MIGAFLTCEIRIDTLHLIKVHQEIPYQGHVKKQKRNFHLVHR